ncbi:hypothetical protein ACE1TF_15220 [Geomicrobium sp. JSM 1781026]|uniref:hypothetical protein n=1 Tax=Geomicrobium sp. JSM 1781026 TaxID=3344580 RepID=UPI0035C03F28
MSKWLLYPTTIISSALLLGISTDDKATDPAEISNEVEATEVEVVPIEEATSEEIQTHQNRFSESTNADSVQVNSFGYDTVTEEPVKVTALEEAEEVIYREVTD